MDGDGLLNGLDLSRGSEANLSTILGTSASMLNNRSRLNLLVRLAATKKRRESLKNESCGGGLSSLVFTVAMRVLMRMCRVAWGRRIMPQAKCLRLSADQKHRYVLF